MPRLALLLAALVLPGALTPPARAQGAGELALPLKPGRYGVGGCDRFNEANSYIGVGQHRDGPLRGKQYLVPQAERQQGFCTLAKLAPMGGVMAGTAECDNGNRVNPTPMGTYRFNYTLHSPTSFTSLGKRYDLCPGR